MILRNIVYSNVSDNPTATRTVSVQITDGDGGTSDAVTKAINVTPVNDRPVINSFGSDPITYIENGADVGIAATTRHNDRSRFREFQGGTLTVQYVAGGRAEDRFIIRTSGHDQPYQIRVESNVLYNGAVIGTFSGGTGTTPLVITFNRPATRARRRERAAEHCVQQRVGKSVGQSPHGLGAGDDGDGSGGTSVAVTKTINVTPVNDAPVLGGISGTVGYTNGAPPINIATTGDVSTPTGTVSDVDSANFDTGKLTVEIEPRQRTPAT